MTDETGLAIWVTSDLVANETAYVATIHFTDDISYPFDPDGAVRYAQQLLKAWGEAEYDAAVYAQITKKLGMEQEQATRLLAKFRDGRPPVNDSTTASPVALSPGVSLFTAKPFLRCEVGDLKWQWDAADVHRHVQHVLEVVPVAALDTLYRKFLIEMGIEPARALAVVEGLNEFREAL